MYTCMSGVYGTEKRKKPFDKKRKPSFVAVVY